MSTECFLICSLIFQTFELYSFKSVFNFGKVSICLVCNNYSFKKGSYINAVYHLIIYFYMYIIVLGFRTSSRHGAK